MKQHSALSIINYPFTIVLLSALFLILPVKAQVNIGSDANPQTFSILELTTTILKGGLRLPQLTDQQCSTLETELKNLTDQNDIAAAHGLVVYNINSGCLEFWNGDAWINLCFDLMAPIDPTTLPLVTGNLTGRTCFDIARSNSGRNNCGTLAERTSTADFSRSDVNTQTYTFTPQSGVEVSNVRFFYVESDSGNIIRSFTYNPTYNTMVHISAATPCTATVVYKPELNTSALGLTADNPLTVDIYVVYNDAADGSGTYKAVKLTAIIKDCICAASE